MAMHQEYFHLSLLSLLAFGCISVLVSAQQSEVSYAFVVDNTGSMHNEIAAVREGIKELLRIAPAAVANYVVVLFNDPKIGPSIKSSNDINIMNFVNRIRHGGGGDCPEMAMTGIRRAIQLSDPGSFIFFFSDASAKDYYLHPFVVSEAKAKDIMIFFVLTGCCKDCESKAFNAYKNVTSEVDGRMYQVSKTGAEEFMKYTVMVAAKDALLMKYTPKSFESVKAMTATGTVPIPENGCSQLIPCSALGLIFVTTLLATVANRGLRNLQLLIT